MASFFYASDAGSLRHTWVPLVAWGTLIAVFGIVVAAMPELTASALVFLLGLGSAIAGLVWVSWAISLRRATGGWWMVSFVPGVLLIVFGAYALLRPGSLAEFLFRAAGAVAVVWGLADMAASWRLRPFFGAWWLRLIRGVLVAGVGVLVFLMPAAGVATAGLLIGVWFIVIGGTTITLGLAAHRLPKDGPAIMVSTGPPEGRGEQPPRTPGTLPPV
jgi:uncharacterized membrane protein HdeD (DUF308 family)